MGRFQITKTRIRTKAGAGEDDWAENDAFVVVDTDAPEFQAAREEFDKTGEGNTVSVYALFADEADAQFFGAALEIKNDAECAPIMMEAFAICISKVEAKLSGGEKPTAA